MKHNVIYMLLNTYRLFEVSFSKLVFALDSIVKITRFLLNENFISKIKFIRIFFAPYSLLYLESVICLPFGETAKNQI